MNPNDPIRQEPAAPQPSAPQPPVSPNDADASKEKRLKSRARAMKLLIGLLVSMVVLLLLNLIPFDQLTAALEDAPAETEPVKTYSDDFFSVPDYEEDVTADTVYQTKYDRRLYYTYGNETVAVTEENADAQGVLCNAFYTYMTALTKGDTDTVNGMFSDAYLEKYGRFQFAPQKIYNMKVKVGSATFLKDGDKNGAYKGYTRYTCEVSYMIRDNNGTLRRDFYKEGETNAQMYEVVERGGEVTITMISAIQDGAPTTEEGNSIMMYMTWIAVIAVAIFIEASSATLTAIWFMPGALVSLVLALLGVGKVTQVLVFFLLSTVLALLGILFFRKRLLKKKPIPTNLDRIIGTDGVVTEAIDNLAAKGEVKIDGKRWSARTEDGSTVEEGAVVTILRIEGVKLIVKKTLLS